MAVSCGEVGRSALNPNAPLFIPMMFQQVEDFSPEWWELVKTTPWFREHWSCQFLNEENFSSDEEDIDNMSPPDSFRTALHDFSMPVDDAEQHLLLNYLLASKSAETALKNLSLKSPKNRARPLSIPEKYREKPLPCVSPKRSPRCIIHQPR
ncbi:hypothetical protein Cni_G07790 [Canna indica]|uniref:Uncharacterized protein n=1 Tax=Canna indica TaxID=4628 RepID=A0AAQ3JZC4_9LILI|nr:hypothetical protein Cni_G07790 [Canna indica]